MKNAHFVEQLENNKNQIINFFADESENFYFSFLNSIGKVGKMTIGTREQWSGCHCRVQYFEQNGTFKNYKNPEGYYITFNVLENMKDNGSLAFSLRKDLIEYWSHSETSYRNVLVVSSLNNTIYKIPIKNLLSYIFSNIKNNTEVFTNGKESLYESVVITLSDKIVTKEQEMKNDEPKSFFNMKYYEPRAIANFCYAKYRCKTAVNMHIYSEDGKFLKTNCLRSIKEAFDELVRLGAFDKGYKTMQRAVATEKLLEYTNGKSHFYYYLTTKTDAAPETLYVEHVIDKTIDNPFYNPNQPYDEFSNMPELIVEDHYEVTKNLPDENTTEETWNNIKNEVEIVTPEEDTDEEYLAEINSYEETKNPVVDKTELLKNLPDENTTPES